MNLNDTSYKVNHMVDMSLKSEKRDPDQIDPKELTWYPVEAKIINGMIHIVCHDDTETYKGFFDIWKEDIHNLGLVDGMDGTIQYIT